MVKLKSVKLPDPGTPNFNAIDPFDARYFDAELATYLSEQSRIAYQAHAEAALALTLAEFDVCSDGVAEEIVAGASKVTAEDVRAEEEKTRHDIKAVVNTIKSHISDEAKPFVHFGATSYDIVAPAQSLQMKEAMHNVVLPRLKTLIEVLIKLTDEYADTVQIGRTHGQHGLPITFGFAMAEYVSRLTESYLRLEELSNSLKGKFAGAVGAYNALSVFVDDPLAFEKSMLGHLGLEPAPYSNQIVPAEGMVRLIDELAITAGIMANIGHDMRHLQRSEIGEVREHFEKGQTGSSTMAHKRNPWNFENVVGMYKQVTAQVVNAHLNLPSEHQRDLTDSASSRFYPLVLAGVASMTTRLSKIMSKIEVDDEAMEKNLYMSQGAIAAEPLYLLFEKHGHTEAHEKSKELSQTALEKGVTLKEVIGTDPEALEYWKKFSDAEKNIIVEPEKNYVGIASEKARSIATDARAKLQ